MRPARSRRRRRILYVAYGLPHVPATGGPTRAYHLVRAAAEGADVTLMGVGEDESSSRHSTVRAFCDEVEFAPAHHLRSGQYPVPAPLTPAVRRLDRAIKVRPSVEWRFDTRPLEAAVERRLQGGGYDLVVAEHTEIAFGLRHVLRSWGGPSVADLHNVLSIHECRVHEAEADAGLSLRRWRQIRRLRGIERAILASYDRITAVSTVDAGYLEELAPSARVDVVPNGVDLTYFGAAAEQRQGADPDDTVVFTGALWYRPNVEGLRLFVDEIWPRVRLHRPRARFVIVGVRPNAEVLAMGGRPGIQVIGPVPDVRPFLASASVAVVPLRLGTGTRLKILEALAAQVPVVSTSLGAEGLDLLPGRDIAVTDAPDAFADAVVHLLSFPGEARVLARGGNAVVRDRYDWETIGARFSDTLRRVTDGA